MTKLLTIVFILFYAGFISAQEDATKIAIIGCHEQNRPSPSLDYLADSVRPDYCIWVGDNVYADTKTDPRYIQRQLDVLASKEAFQKLKAYSEFLVTWDDHDYGLNNAGSEYIFKEESKAIHRKFWNLEAVVPDNRDGIYNSRIDQLENGKKIQFILLDGRYNKVRRGKHRDALGEQQWKWLAEELKKEADVRFIVSGYQILLNRPTIWEAWAKLGRAKKRLISLINESNAKGVVFITGDQHYVEVLKKKKKLPYDAYEIMAAGINKNERPGWAGKRVAGPDITIHSAPFMTIHWQEYKGVRPHIAFKVTDVETEKITLSYMILLADIGL